MSLSNVTILDTEHKCKTPVFNTMKCYEVSHYACKVCLSCTVEYHVIKHDTIRVNNKT